ncbi:hypothetical protein AXF42_Ash015553 [Apostasia shenzhenica]|uniref:VQ domain-containing protein n=1 Tax=Apostasia shenzhenica TaxID=1088818 RepID=A0A2I0AKJ0_9ASPA|nr:hypothetical protein AXF42_Ash015553 [Apostasia shenzhenica]
MAMSEASTGQSNWVHLIHHAAGGRSGDRAGHQPLPFTNTSVAAESTVVTTTPSSTQKISGAGAGQAGSQLSGVGKSGRKRTRASRRAPTTLLNTDTTNFRAMVQQFTGVPAGSYAAAPYISGGQPTINFREQPAVQSYDDYQLRPPAPPPPQQDLSVFSMAGGAEDDFLHGIENPPAGGLTVTEGYFLDEMGGPAANNLSRGGAGTGGGYFL